MAVTRQQAPTGMPDPLRERPPASRLCDIVLNGGVASGVVYPWALLQLARHYRFKSIGGNSVGAMTACLAAAAEYGRCRGVEAPFEVLRQAPVDLAEEDAEGRTTMLRLFQPTSRLERLFQLFVAAVGEGVPDSGSAVTPQPAPYDGMRVLTAALGLYQFWAWWVALFASATVVSLVAGGSGWVVFTLFLATGVAAVVMAALSFWHDLGALTENGFGLCTGRGQRDGEKGLVEWLHEGVQRSAGRQREDRPLTFADLWAVPRDGVPGPQPLADGSQPEEPSIELQMFTSNVTQGRPVRLPVRDPNTRLYYDPQEWQAFFPPTICDALERASTPYVPRSPSDPAVAAAGPAGLVARLRELPCGGMPIVVAARLSLSFPFLFACVPVYAVDYEATHGARQLRRCLLSDGGLCTNFPIHLFDAAHPEWPTFAFLFDSRSRHYVRQSVWIPTHHLAGRGDNWSRFVPGAEDANSERRGTLAKLFGLTAGMLVTMKDWNDRVTGRLPQVRNRVIRLALRRGEGQLNIGMRGKTILQMANEYGNGAGDELVRRFGGRHDKATPMWKEHLYVRAMVELRALRRHLKGYKRSVRAGGQSMPLSQLLEEATRTSSDKRLLREAPDRPDPSGVALDEVQLQALLRAVRAVEALETELAVWEANAGPYRPLQEPELRLRPPI